MSDKTGSLSWPEGADDFIDRFDPKMPEGVDPDDPVAVADALRRAMMEELRKQATEIDALKRERDELRRWARRATTDHAAALEYLKDK